MLLCFFNFSLSAQDLLNEIEDETPVQRVKASYKNSKVINAQSLETTNKGNMDFRISHRFGSVNGGIYELFGLDRAFLRLSFDYGIFDRLQAGIGRSNYEKSYDAYFKYRILWQTENKKKMPISVLWYSSISVNTLRYNATIIGYERDFLSRLNYTNQLIIGRKFSNKLSFQLMPTMVWRNFVNTDMEKNIVYIIGSAGRIKMTNRVAINAEYHYALPNQLGSLNTNSLSIGFDIETGGHVFQLHFTNSPFMLDKAYLTETTGKWLKGDVFFGFNLTRTFDFRKKKKEYPAE